MTDAFGIENKTNDQRISIIVGQLVIQLIAPQPSGLPGAQVVKHHADHVGSLTSSRDKLKVLQDDTREPREQLVEQLARAQILLEQTIEQIDVVSPCHGQPTFALVCDRCRRSASPCRETPTA